MNLLLDTHTFLWFVWQDSRISTAAWTLISDPNNTPYVSPATYWEIAIKAGAGKLKLADPVDVLVTRAIRHNRMVILPISVDHAARVVTLPFHHRDPFDRMLAAQSLVEGYPLVSADAIFDRYGLTRLW